MDVRDNAVQHAEEGLIHLDQGRPWEAAEEFKAALQLNPYSALSGALYNNLGLAYREAGQTTLALVAFQHAIRIQPNYELYYKNLIETYAATGSLSSFQQALAGILKANPENPEALFMLGLAFEQQGDKEAARKAFSRFLQLEPHATLARAAEQHL